MCICICDVHAQVGSAARGLFRRGVLTSSRGPPLHGVLPPSAAAPGPQGSGLVAKRVALTRVRSSPFACPGRRRARSPAAPQGLPHRQAGPRVLGATATGRVTPRHATSAGAWHGQCADVPAPMCYRDRACHFMVAHDGGLTCTGRGVTRATALRDSAARRVWGCGEGCGQWGRLRAYPLFLRAVSREYGSLFFISSMYLYRYIPYTL